MEEITLHNYEAFFLDYSEGNLSTEQIFMLNKFIEKHPELKNELLEYDAIQIPKENFTFDKSNLYKKITGANIDNYIIALIENEISGEDQAELHEVISSSKTFVSLAERYNKTILPKQNIAFPFKSKLKKGIIYSIQKTHIGISAAIIIIALLFPIFNTKKQPHSISTVNHTIAYNSPNKPYNTTEKNIPIAATKQRRDIKRTEQHSIYTPGKNIAKKEDSLDLKNYETIINTDSSQSTFDKQNELLKSVTTKYEITHRITETEYVSKAMNMREAARLFIRKRIFKEENPLPVKITKHELIGSIVNRINKKSNSTIAYSYTEENSIIHYSFSIGKVEFSRTKFSQ